MTRKARITVLLLVVLGVLASAAPSSARPEFCCAPPPAPEFCC